jgi:hypothetical protein
MRFNSLAKNPVTSRSGAGFEDQIINIYLIHKPITCPAIGISDPNINSSFEFGWQAECLNIPWVSRCYCEHVPEALVIR